MSTTPALAVLPFRNASADKNMEFFSDGITEEIIHALSKIKGLNVISRMSSFAYKDTSKTSKEISDELNVDIIVSGGIRISGNTARISAELIEASNEFQFWSKSFDRQMDNIFAIQDELSLAIAEKLREHLGHFELSESLVDSYDISVESYKKYLRGRFEIHKLNAPSTERGIKILTEVTKEAPNFPHAFLDINQAYSYLGTMGILPASHAFMQAQPFLERAIAIAPNLAETQLNLAWIACWQRWDFNATFDHLNNALQIKPTDRIYLTISNSLAIQGKFKAAHKYLDKALLLEPLYAMHLHFRGFIHYLEEDYDNAIFNCKRSLTLQSTIPFPHLTIGLAHALKGETDTALAYFNSLDQELFQDLTKLGGTALTHAVAGNKEESFLAIEDLQAHMEDEHMGSALFFLIMTHVQLGAFDQAAELMEKGIEMHLPNMLLLFTEPCMKPMHYHATYLKWKKVLFADLGSIRIQDHNYQTPYFGKNSLESIKKRLQNHMDVEQPYLDPDLTLTKLADQIDLTGNQLSQLLNVGLAQNFSEFVNRYRVEAFKTLVMQPKMQHLTILAIAYESGFNSKTVFNTFFKKVTGITPKSFWKQVQEN